MSSSLVEQPAISLKAATEVPRPEKREMGVIPILSLPVITLVATGVHWWIAQKTRFPVDSRSYFVFLGIVLALSVITATAQLWWKPLNRLARERFPILAAFVGLLTVWQIATSGFRWFPMPYFPGPEGVLQSMINDRSALLVSAWSSFLLLFEGYTIGVILGLITGICIGWFNAARYWGMPLLKLIGPIPATAWIPLALVLAPSWSPVGLIALAVWFPVTMLTSSGISNTRASYLDVARTLGAGRGYLIFRVAIPAAMPSIFIGLFMGLSAAFLTLVVAETVGVKSGLGWYVGWAQGWAEYGKVYGALVIMAVFFSSIMTLLFKIRDKVLVWQKGVIKW